MNDKVRLWPGSSATGRSLPVSFPRRVGQVLTSASTRRSTPSTVVGLNHPAHQCTLLTDGGPIALPGVWRAGVAVRRRMRGLPGQPGPARWDTGPSVAQRAGSFLSALSWGGSSSDLTRWLVLLVIVLFVATPAAALLGFL